MELMPHIKALLDDLVKMTKHIGVKRSDLANKYEDNTRTVLLYQQTSEIMHGMPSFFTYNVYPREVLNSYGKWVKTSDSLGFGEIKPLTSSENIISKMSSGTKMTISKDAPPKNGGIGEGWIKLVDDGMFFTTNKYNCKTKEYSYSIVKDDDSGNPSEVLQSVIFNGNIYNIKNLEIYIRDEKYNKYVKVDVNFINEYIENPENKEDLDLSYSYSGRFENNQFIYDVFVENTKNHNEMILENESVIPEPKQKYLFRYKTVFHFSSSDYYDNNEYYFNKNEINDNTEYVTINGIVYVRIDDNEYYKSSDDIYSLYTSDMGVIDDLYYRYRELDEGIVKQERYEKDGQEFNRYESFNGNFVLYYSYDSNPSEENRCIIRPDFKVNDIEFITYINGEHEESAVGLPLYYFYEDQLGSYKKEILDENNYIYTISTNNTDTKYMMVTETPVLEKEQYDTCVYINNSSDNEYYIREKVLTDSQVTSYYNDRNKIPDIYRDDLKDLMKDYILNLYCPDYNNPEYSIPIYTGETNRYYRELNGLPPLNVSLYHPTINRLVVNPEYKGSNTNPYLYELTDSEVERMEELGYLEKYQNMYPNYTYLFHLGKHRVDVIKARDAAPYDILYLDSAKMDITYSMFMENYPIAKNYIFKRYYKPNMFGTHQYYHAYIGFNICLLTLIMCMTKSGEILIKNKYMDKETVDLVLRSYGFDHTFDSIPLIYRREIAKNILKLIRNKGIDSVYEIIYDIFNIDNIEIYEYYFNKYHMTDNDNSLLYYLIDNNGNYEVNDETKEKITVTKKEYDEGNYEDYKLKPAYDISLLQVPLSSDSIIKDMLDPSNKLNYDNIINSDSYWGVYESKESVKNKILDIPFDYMNTKYISLNNKFNLTELNFNSSYLLNYLLDSTTLNNINIKLNVEDIDELESISNLIITLFAIQAIKYGFDGNIPSDIVSAATVYKFNLDKTIATDNGESKRIIEYYLDYMSQEGSSKALEIKNQIDRIRQSNRNTNSVEGLIYNDRSDVSVSDMAESYLNNVTIDNKHTEINESSLYNKLLEYREKSKTISDFRCFDELLHCISICNETKNAYKLTVPVWEKMYECQYKNTINNTAAKVTNTEKMYYTDILHSWKLVNSKDKKLEILNELDSPKELIRLIDDTYIDKDNYVIVKVAEKDEYGDEIVTYTIKEKDITSGDLTDTEYIAFDDKIYYEHFTNIETDTHKAIVTSKNPISYKFPSVVNKTYYIVCINDITRAELLNVSSLDILIDRIDVYYLNNLFNGTNLENENNLDLNAYISSSVDSNNIDSAHIGNNNYAYIGYKPLQEFIDTTTENLNGQVMYVEVTKNYNTNDNVYDVTIYKKCEYALSYAMYLREKSQNLYNYIQKNDSESPAEYIERLTMFSSTIIATIQNNIDSEDIKAKFNLSYVDFSNIINYIKLVINVFKSYSIDLSSMDTIYTIDDKNNNRVKMIDIYSTNEKYSIDSNIRLSSEVSSNEQNFVKDVFSIRDELYVEFYSRQFYDTEPMATDVYYRVNNTANPRDDYLISSYYYGRSLETVYNLYDEIDNKIIGK